MSFSSLNRDEQLNFDDFKIETTGSGAKLNSEIYARVCYIFFLFELLGNESPSIESFFRDGSIRYTDHRGQQDTYISRTYHPVSVSYLRNRTHSTRAYVCITFAFGAKISPFAGVEAVGMSRLSELLWLPNGHNMCVTYVALNASSTPLLSLN